ncbi:MAG: regulatory protein RecX [Peptococcaceae bacterium]
MEQLEQAKAAALKFIAARVRTRQEVVQQLHKKGYSQEIIAAVIAFLQEYQYLDDAAYCKAWIHDKMQFHPCGRQKMAIELAKKVSDRQLIQQSLEQYFSREEELELALAAAYKKLNGSAAVRPEQLSRFLYSKGYDGVIIARVLDRQEIIQQLDQKQKDNNF